MLRVDVYVSGAQGPAGAGGDPTTAFGTNKGSIANNDRIAILDSANSNLPKHTLWSLVKSTLKTYFDTLYPSGSGTSTGTNTGDQTSVSGNAGTVTTINGRIAAGNNVTFTGSGTSASPYTVNATGEVTLTGDQTLSGKKLVNFREEVANLGNSGTAKTLTLAATVQQTTLTGNCTFTMPTVVVGASFLIDVIGNGTAYTATFTGVDWNGTTPTLRTGSGDRNTFAFRAKPDGSGWLGLLSGSGGGGSSAWADITGKPAAVTALTGTNTGDQDLSSYATTTALTSGLAGKAPASGIAPSAITGTAVTLSGTQTITGDKTFGIEGTTTFAGGTVNFGESTMYINGGELTFQTGSRAVFNSGVISLAGGVYSISLTYPTITASRTVTFPDASGTLLLTNGSGALLTSLNGSQIASGIVPGAITGTAVTLSGTQTITGNKTFPYITFSNGNEAVPSKLYPAQGTSGVSMENVYLPDGAGTLALTQNTDGHISGNDIAYGTIPAAALGNAAPVRRLLTGVGPHTALVGERLTLYNASTVAQVNDPTGTTAGQQYTLIVQLGTTNFNGSGTVFSASRFEIVRSYNGSSWSTVPAVVSGDITATTIGATTPGTGAFTTVTASGAVSGGTITSTNAGGTNTLAGITIIGTSGSLRPSADGARSVGISGTRFGSGWFIDLQTTTLTASGTVTEGVYTVATTPTHSLGAQIRINNATGATIGSVVAGTGSQHVVARSNGTQWICTSIIIP